MAYSQAVADEICERIAEGHSLRSICASDEMPDRRTVMRWLAAEEDFATKCARARVLQADVLEEDMAAIEDKTLSGEVDPVAARVVLSSKQWRASKLAPKKYGDKLDVEHKGTFSVQLQAQDREL